MVLSYVIWEWLFQRSNQHSTWFSAYNWVQHRTFHFYCSYCLLSLGVYHLLALKPSDIVYCPLPLYHSAGGALGVGKAILSGITVVIRRKFSASQYFADCMQHNCTVRLHDPVLVPFAFGLWKLQYWFAIA